MTSILKMALVIGACASFHGAQAQLPGVPQTHTYYGERIGEIQLPDNTGGGTSIQCKENPNKICVKVTFMRAADPSSGGKAELYANGTPTSTFSFGKLVETKESTGMKLTFFNTKK